MSGVDLIANHGFGETGRWAAPCAWKRRRHRTVTPEKIKCNAYAQVGKQWSLEIVDEHENNGEVEKSNNQDPQSLCDSTSQRNGDVSNQLDIDLEEDGLVGARSERQGLSCSGSLDLEKEELLVDYGEPSVTKHKAWQRCRTLSLRPVDGSNEDVDDDELVLLSPRLHSAHSHPRAIVEGSPAKSSRTKKESRGNQEEGQFRVTLWSDAQIREYNRILRMLDIQDCEGTRHCPSAVQIQQIERFLRSIIPQVSSDTINCIARNEIQSDILDS